MSKFGPINTLAGSSKFILVFVCWALVGCSSRFVSHDELDQGSAPPSRYSIAQDTAPVVALSADQIELLTPRLEPRSRGGNKSPYTVLGKQYRVMETARGYKEQGVASWYGAKFHGHLTSNGEVFDMNVISAAHKSLPLPSWVRVTNLANGQSIDVRVNDRGPFHDGRIIDLSYAAAVKLGFQDKGTTPVLVEAIEGKALDTESYLVQVAVFSDKERAFEFRRALAAEQNDDVQVYQSDFYKVRIGPVTYSRAIELQSQLDGTDLGKPLIVVLP